MSSLDVLRVGVVSISDRASSGVYEDKGIPALKEWLAQAVRKGSREQQVHEFGDVVAWVYNRTRDDTPEKVRAFEDLCEGEILDGLQVPGARLHMKYRGRIKDREGQTLASSVAVPSIWAIPKDVDADPDKRRELAKVLGLGQQIELIPDMDDPRNLFGQLQLAAPAAHPAGRAVAPVKGWGVR